MQTRRRGCALAGLILLVLSMIPRPALSQLVEISVQLDVLRAGPLNDGCFGVFCITTDTTVEAFGTITVDRVTVQWNKYPCGAGWGGDCLAAGPLTTDVREFQRLSWREQFLSVRGASFPTTTGFRRSNHNFRFTKFFLFGSRPSITVSWRFQDRDRLSANDTWCAGTIVIFGLDGRFELFDPITRGPRFDPRCSIVIRLSNRLVRTGL